MKSEIKTSYDMGSFPNFDDIIKVNVGRSHDFSGAGGGRRDLGWIVTSEFEAERVTKRLKMLSLRVERVDIET